MAKTTTTNYVINAQKAVAALKAVSQSTNAYNAQLQQTRTQLNTLNATGSILRTQLSGLTSAANRAAGALNTQAQATRLANSHLTTLSTKTRQAKGDLGSLSAFVNTLKVDFENLGKVMFISVVHRGVGALIGGMRASAEQAQELQLRIGEIQTISLKMQGAMLVNSKSTNEWAQQMLALSANTGIPVLEQAEAIYNALSNQVITAGEATSFMSSQMKLAITSVSTLNHATEVTSTVINAYGKSATDAERINATLFKGVDLGRFRLEELGSSFGRVAVLSNTLGVSFEEQVGSLALLTRLGLDADVANTLLANVMNALIKPSKEMTALMEVWGVNSGEAAIATFGFSGVMRKLGEEASKGAGELSEIGRLMEDIRAITGTAGLTQNIDQLDDSIKKVSNSTEQYNKAFELQMENLGVRGKVQLEKFKQYFLTGFGLPIQKTLVEVSESFGGADKAMSAIITNFRRIVIVGATVIALLKLKRSGLLELATSFSSTSAAGQKYATMQATQHAAQQARNKASILAQQALNAQTKANAAAAQAANALQSGSVLRPIFDLKATQAAAHATAVKTKAMQAARTAVMAEQAATQAATGANFALAASEAAVTAGVTILVAVISELVIQEIHWKETHAQLVQELRTSEIEKNRRAFEALSRAIDDGATSFERTTKGQFREYFATLAELRKLNSAFSADATEKYVGISKTLFRSLKGASDSIKDNLRELTDAAREAERSVERIEDKIAKLKSDGLDREIDASIEGKNPLEAAAILEARKEELHRQAVEAMRAGDEKLALDLFDKVDKIGEETIRNLKRAREEAEKDVVKRKITVDKTGIAVRDSDDGSSDTVKLKFPKVKPPKGPRGFKGRARAAAGIVEEKRVIEIEEEKELGKAAEIGEKLTALEERRKALEAERLVILKESLEVKKKEKELADEAIKKAEEAEETFRNTLTDLDTFKPNKKGEISPEADSKKLDELIKTAIKSGKAAGLGGGELAVILREASKLKVELERLAETEITKNAIDETARRLTEQEKLIQEFNQKKVEAQKKAFTTGGEATVESGALLEDLKKLFDPVEGRIPWFGQQKEGLDGNSGAKQFKEELTDIQQLIGLIAAGERQLGTERDAGTFNPVTIEALAKAYEELNKKIAEFERFHTRVAQFGRDKSGRNKLGEMTLPSDTAGGETVKGEIGDVVEKLKAAKKALAEAGKVGEGEKTALESAKQTGEVLKSLQEKYQEAAAAAGKAGAISLQTQRDLNIELEKTVTRLNAIIEKQKEVHGVGGEVGAGNAHGRVGIDSMLAPISTGESVMNRLATRQYGPLLRAMNNSSPSFNNNTSNYGDTTINATFNLPNGTSSQHVTQIASGLSRLRRQGRWN